MRIAIENSQLRVVIETFGAELKSLTHLDTGLEYLWQGDPAVWPDTAPFLFPVVARQLDDRYTLDGKTYTMPMHGFAKDREFEVVEAKSDSLTLALREDPETLGWYPFPFRLITTFSLDGAHLLVKHRVENHGGQDMPFSLGEHPGFRAPMMEGESLEDFYLEFSQEETAPRWYLDDEIIVGCEPGINGRILPVTTTLFNRGALIFKGLNSDSVTLRSRNHSHSVTMDLRGWGYLGIWAKPAASYVCIEPWNGLASFKDASYDIWRKEGIRRLAPGAWEEFTMDISVT